MSNKRDLQIIEGGGVATAQGFHAGGVFAGIKTPGEDKYDLGLLYSDRDCAVAGTFSQNSVLSPSVTVTKDVVARGRARAVIANSGCANCAVGKQGLIDAQDAASIGAAELGVDADDVLVASTGVIGVELPMNLIRDHTPRIDVRDGDDAGLEFAKAIMTTDTHPKHIAVRYEASDGSTVTVGGCAKGAGMIHPNMATMLCFISTDADVEQSFLQSTLSDAVTLSFNQIDIDGDQSTNDTVALLANGASGSPRVAGGDEDSERFANAVAYVNRYLAIELARDGEGARHLITAVVEGAGSDVDARKAARSVAASLLVRTAVYGRDPNWGRIMMAVGKTGISLVESKIDIFVNGIQIVHEGKAIAYNVQSVIAALDQPEVELRVDLNCGDGFGEAWGCDLTEEYVVFNSAYTT
ncbi:MAG: bifunctional glutamate N-acetyltransferase/amino-acid acetyltransferase ArgJ [Chloroflexi bacterium]|nr:bifunctional glutamate N-acetyltransferase/amino-acid acetyltransferase ArgJ [Chloroflexota bacterium]MYF78625.1 bifunctional glutamate N-acetyltransferase/amino-acid acetyltransferase ArgJ [Chloroflexota bacterium]MYK62422.1 bifunctional glutamate N-acetyltransferase/amino-acid acetyltransferase ArgJ [Chloroflexota bacterium]